MDHTVATFGMQKPNTHTLQTPPPPKKKKKYNVLNRFVVSLALHHGIGVTDETDLENTIYAGLPRDAARVETVRLIATYVIAYFASRSLVLMGGPWCALHLPSRSLHR